MIYNVETASYCVVGCGYVGMPLLNALRSSDLNAVGYDLDHSKHNNFISSDFDTVLGAEVIIICLPTPVTTNNQPDLSLIDDFMNKLEKALDPDEDEPFIILESTYAPGTTDSILSCFTDYGYSPERINPGDSEHDLRNTVKLVSGSNSSSLYFMHQLYLKVADKVHLCPSIRVAEAAKIIENTQRDINIALMNELSLIFDKAGIDTLDVLEAASTKWNFMNVKPGLVGGHCIGVDPYYLAEFAYKNGVEPTMVLAGRSTNEGAIDRLENIIKSLDVGDIVHFEGYTFKGDCEDVRNSKTKALITRLRYQTNLQISARDAVCESVEITPVLCDIMVLTVNHSYIRCKYKQLMADNYPSAIIDLHGIIDRGWANRNGILLWRP